MRVPNPLHVLKLEKPLTIVQILMLSDEDHMRFTFVGSGLPYAKWGYVFAKDLAASDWGTATGRDLIHVFACDRWMDGVIVRKNIREFDGEMEILTTRKKLFDNEYMRLAEYYSHGSHTKPGGFYLTREHLDHCPIYKWHTKETSPFWYTKKEG